ncbi:MULTISPECIES: hypothetical protein [Bartonella]|uniref:hypothetical protein n=1 Tax=Bartonella TaxID=773 RepID=UPI0018DE6454|nr:MULTISPECIES: hypothetical protein [Bartonella]MBH9976152.1 hypothetical protein [Bartonella choladocola]MBI0015506.1 hypothetical protein [Bartonella sp. B10834G3]
MRGFGRNSRPLSTAHRPLFAAFSALTTRKVIARPDRLFYLKPKTAMRHGGAIKGTQRKVEKTMAEVAKR